MTDLVPAGARAAERFGPLQASDEQGLYVEERQQVAAAVPKRRREFAAVRRLARASLGELGAAPRPIVKGRAGAPTWPDGFVGSITHCEGYGAAAVAFSADVRAIGIDAEPNRPLPADVLTSVASLPEREHLAQLQTVHPEVAWDCLLFCIKEATYKVWYPLHCTWIDFDAASVRIDAEGSYEVEVSADGRGLLVRGAWCHARGILLVCAWA